MTKTWSSVSDLTNEDMLDSRDMEERRQELEDAKELHTDNPEEHPDLDEDEAELFKVLNEIKAECESSGWKHGIGFIRETYFKDYAQDLAEDIGAIPKDVSWPCSCIDWEQASDELKQDYTASELGSVTFYWRAA